MAFLEALKARAGALLLDVLKPGWENEVDPETLDLADCEACVLGQLFGRYSLGAEKLFSMRAKDPKNPKAFESGVMTACYQTGFDICPGEDDMKKYKHRMNYSRLTDAWKNEIARRV